jgi:nucleoside-diphosphate kinase
MSNTERTYIMIKPDGVHRGLVGEIIKRFEQKGFKLVALKFMQVSFHTFGFLKHWIFYYF